MGWLQGNQRDTVSEDRHNWDSKRSHCKPKWTEAWKGHEFNREPLDWLQCLGVDICPLRVPVCRSRSQMNREPLSLALPYFDTHTHITPFVAMHLLRCSNQVPENCPMPGISKDRTRIDPKVGSYLRTGLHCLTPNQPAPTSQPSPRPRRRRGRETCEAYHPGPSDQRSQHYFQATKA